MSLHPYWSIKQPLLSRIAICWNFDSIAISERNFQHFSLKNVYYAPRWLSWRILVHIQCEIVPVLFNHQLYGIEKKVLKLDTRRKELQHTNSQTHTHKLINTHTQIKQTNKQKRGNFQHGEHQNGTQVVGLIVKQALLPILSTFVRASGHLNKN